MKKTTNKSVAARKEREPWLDAICDDCQHGTWNDVFWNRDPQGKPLTLRCPYYENGKYGILRGTKACSKYAER
ncbi:MAG: hypothetical protein IJS13_06775 [Paludibacteraceae bacterium]|nr:hypothetical protein [Paludibacteraceae bacterium]